MQSTAYFYFHQSLNDFLKKAAKNSWTPYPFEQAPAVKDAIEALGVPHVEVFAVQCNQVPVELHYRLQEDDRIQVYPQPYHTNGDALVKGTSNIENVSFILDVHLGALARALRMLGLDVLYQNVYEDKMIADIAARENRIVLTRDVGLLKYKVIKRGYWLRSQHLPAQLTEVIYYFHLQNSLKPFSRCIACNGLIIAVPKENVIQYLPPKTALYYHTFYQCAKCKKVYWKGSHYNNMLRTVQHLQLG